MCLQNVGSHPFPETGSLTAWVSPHQAVRLVAASSLAPTHLLELIFGNGTSWIPWSFLSKVFMCLREAESSSEPQSLEGLNLFPPYMAPTSEHLPRPAKISSKPTFFSPLSQSCCCSLCDTADALILLLDKHFSREEVGQTCCHEHSPERGKYVMSRATSLHITEGGRESAASLPGFVQTQPKVSGQ